MNIKKIPIDEIKKVCNIYEDGTILYKDGSKPCQSKDFYGYITIDIRGIGAYRVHRIILVNFCPIPNETEMTVNHKDKNVQNNHIGNLEWMTQSENSHDARHSSVRRLEDLKDEEIISVYLDGVAGKVTLEIAKTYNIDIVSVQNILSRSYKPNLVKDFGDVKNRRSRYKTDMEIMLKIKEDIESGDSAKEIAERYNVPKQLIYDFRCGKVYKSITPKVDKRVGGEKLSKEQVFDIIEKHNTGMSHTEIAKEYNVLPLTVKNIILRRTWKSTTKGIFIA